MADRVIQRNDTAARWQSINPILATGEIGIEIDGAKGYKIGDGKTRWNDLPYPANPTNVVHELGNDENAVPSQKLVTEKLSELGSEVKGLGSIELYRVSKDNISNSRIKELYLIGTDANKGYRVRDFLVYEDNIGNKRKTFVIYDSDRNAVAQMDRPFSEKGVLPIYQLNESGITGYVVEEIKEDDNINESFELNTKFISQLVFNPSINVFLSRNSYNPKATTNDERANKIVQELYLMGTDANKGYRVTDFLVYEDNIGNKRKTFVIYDSDRNAVAQMDRPFSEKGVLPIYQLNESGITGYVVCVFPEELNKLSISNANIRMDIATLIDQNPSIKLYLEKENSISSEIKEKEEYGTIRGQESKSFDNSLRMISNLNQSSRLSGIIRKISIRSNGEGEAYFGIGFVDQNKKAILKRIFSVNVVEGNNEFEVIDLCLNVEIGDILFGLPYYVENQETSLFTYTYSSTDNGDNWGLSFATSLGGEQISYVSMGGGKFSHANFSWEVISVWSPFAFKEDVKKMSEEVSNANSLANQALSNSFKVTDRNGNVYKMVVYNGVIQLIPQKFKNIAVIGNSITLHGINTDVNWLTKGYGMAASTPETDFSAFILESCRKDFSDATLVRKNLAHWETSLNLTDAIKEEVRNFIAGKDLVVIKLGENVSNMSSYKNAFNELIEFCLSVNPSAEYVVCSTFWVSAIKDNAMREVALSKGLQYCVGANTDAQEMESLGHWMKSYDGSYFEITNTGVQRHPSDIGMLMIANSILSVLRLNKINKLHNISVSASNIECYTQGVEGGIVTVSSLSIPNIKTIGGSDVLTTKVADGKYVFTMPNEDVVIS